MRKTANVERRFKTEHRILDKLAKIMPKVGEEYPGMAYPQVAEKIGEQVHAMLSAKRSFEQAGILRTRIDYPKGQSGRVSVWTLTLPLPIAHEELTKEHERQLVRPSTKAQREKERASLVAPASLSRLIVGDEAESPFEELRRLKKDEPMALIAAAREYRGRFNLVAQRVQEMREQGIEVSEEAFRLPQDPILESISLVVPAFDRIVSERDRLLTQVDGFSRRVTTIGAERDEAIRERDGLRRQLGIVPSRGGVATATRKGPNTAEQ